MTSSLRRSVKAPKNGRLAQVGQDLPDLGLEDHDDPEDHEGQEGAEQPVEGLQVQPEGHPVEDHEHEGAQGHLHGVGAPDELEELVDDEGDDEDVEGVEPGELGRGEEGGEALDDHGGPPSPGRGQDGVADPDHLDHLPHVVHAHEVGAAEDAGRHRRRGAEEALAHAGRSSTLPRKLLREGPTSSGRSRARKLGQAPPGPRGCGQASFAKPRPGSRMHALPGDARGRGQGQALAQLRGHLAHDVVVARALVHGREAAAQVHGHRGHAPRRDQAGQGRDRSGSR